MKSTQLLTERLQASRPRLMSLAYRMLGSAADAEDALQDAWIRIRQFEPGKQQEVENADGWVTTVVARTCMNKLRARKVRGEGVASPTVPDMIVGVTDASKPEADACLAEDVGLALQVVLDTLPPGERVAFVLHDLFDRPYSEIATLLDCSRDAARQLASRGRRHTRSGERSQNNDPAAERRIVDAFFAASQGSDLGALLKILHPDVVFRADGGATRPAATAVIHGAMDVANRAKTFAVTGAVLQPVQVNGSTGVIVRVGKRAVAIMAFTITADRISEIYCLLDTDRIAPLLLPTSILQVGTPPSGAPV